MRGARGPRNELTLDVVRSTGAWQLSHGGAAAEKWGDRFVRVGMMAIRGISKSWTIFGGTDSNTARQWPCP